MVLQEIPKIDFCRCLTYQMIGLFGPHYFVFWSWHVYGGSVTTLPLQASFPTNLPPCVFQTSWLPTHDRLTSSGDERGLGGVVAVAVWPDS